MQPFIQKKESVVAASDPIKRKPDEEAPYDVMTAVADDLIQAIHSKDTAGVAEALRAASELMTESAPQEGE